MMTSTKNPQINVVDNNENNNKIAHSQQQQLEHKESQNLDTKTPADQLQQQQQTFKPTVSIGARQTAAMMSTTLARLIEKSVIVHKDENGFGLRIKGQAPVYIEHVHEGGAAWRAGVRSLDSICKVNGIPVNQMDHKDVVLMFKSCSRFVALTLMGSQNTHTQGEHNSNKLLAEYQTDLISDGGLVQHHQRQYSIYSHLGLDDRRLLNTRTGGDSLSLFVPNNYAIVDGASQSSLLMDRTRSCKTKITTTTTTSSKMLNKRDDSNEEVNEKRLAIAAGGSETKGGGDTSAINPQDNLKARTLSPPQSISRNPSSAKQQQQQQQQQQQKPKVVNKRIEIIRELIDTERTHTERLRCLDELFYRPLKQTGYLTSEQLRSVFSCHRTLYKIHRQIYRILLSANYDIYSEPLIGSALLEIFEGDLKRRLERASCSFCSAQATNVELLNKLTRRDTKVGELLAQITSQRMIGRLGIKDLLASCFQRLTKYPLLLENLLKATPQVNAHELLHDQEERDKRAARLKLRLLGSPSSGRVRSSNGSDDDDDDDNDDYEDEEQDDDDTDEEARRNSRRMLAISLAEEREFIERALDQSRGILIHVNESIRVAMSRLKLKEIWRRTDKYPGVPLIDISKQQVLHEGLLTLRLARRSFDVYVLLLNDYIIILTREGQDKYRLKFFTPEGKANPIATPTPNSLTSGTLGAPQLTMTTGQTVYSPVFVIDEHLTTRDAATDENGFYLLCKRKDDSRIYEFASRSPAERAKWRDKIQSTIEHQMARNLQDDNQTGSRRPSNGSTLTKSSSEISANGLSGCTTSTPTNEPSKAPTTSDQSTSGGRDTPTGSRASKSSGGGGGEPTKIVGTISYVIDDGIVMPSKLETSRVLVDQAIQVNILYGTSTTTATKGTLAPSDSPSS